MVGHDLLLVRERCDRTTRVLGLQSFAGVLACGGKVYCPVMELVLFDDTR